MKKIILILTALVALSACVVAQKPQTVIVFSEHEALGNMRTRFLNEFFQNVEKESKGRVKIEAHWAGELSTSYDALKNVKDGSKIQFATIVPEYAPNELVLHQLFKSFPIGPTVQRQVEFFSSIYKSAPALSAELEEQNIEPVLIATGFPVAFFSANPVESLDGIKGQVWRSASFWHRDFLTNAGAVPVTMPWGQQVFDALADGSLTGLMVNIDSGYDINAHKVAPYILYSKDLWLGHEYIIGMNKDVWNALSAKDKKAIQKAAKKAQDSLGKLMEDSLAELLAVLEENGATVRELSADEVAFWNEMTDFHAIQDKWAAEQEQKGVANVRQVLDVLRKKIEARE